MATFEVALSGDFRLPDGSAAYPSFDLGPLQANPDISFLFTSSDFLIPQLTQALRVANKWAPIGEPNHVIFTGFDGF